MLKRTIAWLGLLSITASVLAASITRAPLSEQGVEAILGRWDMTVHGADAPYPSWFEIIREGERLTGCFVGRVGHARPIPHIEFVDGQLTLSLPVQYEKLKEDLVFKGRLTGQRLEGTTKGEDGQTIKWTAVRAPELKAASQPKWGQPIRLFNGRDLSGWKLRDPKKAGCWSAENGVLTNRVPCTDIITEQKFKDFKLHLEFNLAEKSNSGVYLRGRYEVQIEDNYGQEPHSRRMGGIYGFLKPTVNAARKHSEWQSYDITLIGRHVTVVLNGQTIIDHQEIPGITGGALDSDEGAPGPLMLQGDHGKISYRNIVLTPARQ